MNNTAEEIATLKNNLIDFASQGGDQRTQGTAERLINELLQEHTAQTLDRLREKVSNLKRRDKHNINSYHNNAIDEVLQLIEEVSDE